MDNVLTWTQFATVMGLLTLVAGVASYFFKQWQESAFGRLCDSLDAIEGRLTQRLDAIERRLDGIEAKMVTRDELRADLAGMQLRLKSETPASPAEEARG